jgi:hypothetical protein
MPCSSGIPTSDQQMLEREVISSSSPDLPSSTQTGAPVKKSSLHNQSYCQGHHLVTCCRELSLCVDEVVKKIKSESRFIHNGILLSHEEE